MGKETIIDDLSINSHSMCTSELKKIHGHASISKLNQWSITLQQGSPIDAVWVSTQMPSYLDPHL